ncbi:YeiH family protein [Roseivivax sp.]
MTTQTLRDRFQTIFPGLAVTALVAVTAAFLSEHYGAPAMLMAILLGIALHFLSEEGRTAPGVDFAAKVVLRFGVALLGLRISAGLVADLGFGFVGLIVLATAATIGVALLAAPLFGRRQRFALLTGGSVAICGASAAMAIAAVLPRDERSEQDIVFTVVGVTVLSTFAMILYPMLAAWLGFDATVTGVFLGGTIHDVAQVVGAGYSVSDEVGDVATLVKLIRVSLLAPVVLLAALAFRRSAEAGSRPPLLPGFVLAFLVLAGVNSTGVVPDTVNALASDLSRWALLTAIAAVGMKTSLPKLMQVGRAAMLMLCLETVFLAGFVALGAIFVLG